MTAMQLELVPNLFSFMENIKHYQHIWIMISWIFSVTFCGRDMMLEASRFLGHDRANEETLIESDNKEMETYFILHDDVLGYMLSKCEVFYNKFKAKS